MATKANTEATETSSISRVIEVEEEIWMPADKGERGDFLSLEDQRGRIQLDLTTPLTLSDQNPVESLTVRAPTMRQIQEFQGTRGSDAQRAEAFFGGCCVGIKPADIQNLHGRDWTRLTRLVTNFIS